MRKIRLAQIRSYEIRLDQIRSYEIRLDQIRLDYLDDEEDRHPGYQPRHVEADFQVVGVKDYLLPVRGEGVRWGWEEGEV